MASALGKVKVIKKNYKIIIAIGTSGTGKSTIINMLYNDETTASACEAPLKTGEGTDSVTKEATWLLDAKSSDSWTVYGDCVGFGDPQVKPQKIIAEIRKLLLMLKGGVHGIMLMTKYGRISDSERRNLNLIAKILPDWQKCCLFVVTHCTKLPPTEESEINTWKTKMITDWIKNDELLRSYVVDNGRNFVFANNDFNEGYEQLTRQHRLLTLKEIKTFIASRDTLHVLDPDAATTFQRYFEHFFRYYLRQWQDTWVIGNLVKVMLDPKVHTGECPICYNLMELKSTAHTPCHHVFHTNCIEKALKDTNACPVCRKAVTELYLPELEISPVATCSPEELTKKKFLHACVEKAVETITSATGGHENDDSNID